MTTEELNLAIDKIGQNIGGDWLLLGGSLVRYAIDATRGTHDIDLVRVPLTNSNEHRTQLINEMKAIGLSPEQVNSSVEFFLKQLLGWESHLILLRSFPSGKIFRPTLTLFAALKLKRATPIDLKDIEQAAKHWGLEEFKEDQFRKWASSREIEIAQTLNLISS